MSSRARTFVDAWIRKNLSFTGDARDETATPEAEALTESCIVEAESAGIPRDELAAECGDLVAYIQGKLDAGLDS